MGFFYAMQNTGQILRSKKNGKSRYTPISNEILQSETLTPEEKSILVHLLSLPENWVVYKGQIWKNMNIGRDRFSKHWNGLVEKGYIISIRMIDKDTNLIKGWNHVVYEEPVLAENRIDGESDLLNFSNTETQLVYKEEIEQSNNLTKEEEREKEKPKKVFKAPTLEEVKEYLKSQNSPIDPERFINYYEATDWMRGNSKIKNWKACVKTWESKEHNSKPTTFTIRNKATLDDD
jgi:hypothetical protein